VSLKKISVLLLALVALFLLSGCPGGPPPASVVVGEQAPEFTLLNMAGESVSLSDFRISGQPGARLVAKKNRPWNSSTSRKKMMVW